MLETNITSNNIDKGTKFNSISIVENVYDNEFEYICDYDVDLKFKDVKVAGDRKLQEYINNNIIKDKRKLSKSYEERPKVLFDYGVVTEFDVEADTVDPAIEDYLNINKNNIGKLFNLVNSLFNYNIPEQAVNNIIDKGEVELPDKKKVKMIEFNTKKSEINRITVVYDDNSTVTVELPEPVTSKKVDSVIPDKNLLSLYLYQGDWLNEDYESTIGLLNEIFGIDLETLKGGKVIW